MQSARRGRRVVERRRHVGPQRVPIGAADHGIRRGRVPRIGRRRVDTSACVTGHSSPRVALAQCFGRRRFQQHVAQRHRDWRAHATHGLAGGHYCGRPCGKHRIDDGLVDWSGVERL